MAKNSGLVAPGFDFVLGIGDGSAAKTLDSALAPRREINGGPGNDILSNTRGDDDIAGFGGNDYIFVTTGNDIIYGNDRDPATRKIATEFDTVDYTKLGAPITLFPRGGTGNGGNSSLLVEINRIIGAPGQPNAIDASVGSGPASVSVDLGNNQLAVDNIPKVGTLKFVVENFVNVTGSPNKDSIVGNNSANTLNGFGGDDTVTGGAGNDTVLGGDGSDRLLGTNERVRGINEQDALTGGNGSDAFVLGDEKGLYYVGAGDKDFAKITDFDINDAETIVLKSGEYSVIPTKSGFDIISAIDNDLIGSVDAIGASDAFSKSSGLLAGLPVGNFTIAAGQTLGSIFVGV